MRSEERGERKEKRGASGFAYVVPAKAGTQRVWGAGGNSVVPAKAGTQRGAGGTSVSPAKVSDALRRTAIPSFPRR